jgi:hypothetical protein
MILLRAFPFGVNRYLACHCGAVDLCNLCIMDLTVLLPPPVGSSHKLSVLLRKLTGNAELEDDGQEIPARIVGFYLTASPTLVQALGGRPNPCVSKLIEISSLSTCIIHFYSSFIV